MLRPARYNAQERTLSLYAGSMVRRHSKENAGLDRNLAWSQDIAMGLSYCVDYTVFGENAVAMENDRARRHTLWGQRCRWVIPNTAVFAGFAGAAFTGEHELHLFDNRIGWALGAVVAAGAMTAASVISLKQARAVTEDRCRQNNIAANWPIDARARMRAAEYLRQARMGSSVAPLLAIVG